MGLAETREEFMAAIEEIGLPVVVKPVMSSSGHGQSTVKTAEQIDAAVERVAERLNERYAGRTPVFWGC